MKVKDLGNKALAAGGMLQALHDALNAREGKGGAGSKLAKVLPSSTAAKILAEAVTNALPGVTLGGGEDFGNGPCSQFWTKHQAKLGVSKETFLKQQIKSTMWLLGVEVRTLWPALARCVRHAGCALRGTL